MTASHHAFGITLVDLAKRFLGEVHEIPGSQHDPFIQWCLASCGLDPESPDETPWCSAFLNRCAWLLNLPRSHSARARSWLDVGTSVNLEAATGAYDVVVLRRGTGAGAAGPDERNAPGHVGLYIGLNSGQVYVLGGGGQVYVLGGNQGNGVTVAPFPAAHVLGVRRLV